MGLRPESVAIMIAEAIAPLEKRIAELEVRLTDLDRWAGPPPETKRELDATKVRRQALTCPRGEVLPGAAE